MMRALFATAEASSRDKSRSRCKLTKDTPSTANNGANRSNESHLLPPSHLLAGLLDQASPTRSEPSFGSLARQCATRSSGAWRYGIAAGIVARCVLKARGRL